MRVVWVGNLLCNTGPSLQQCADFDIIFSMADILLKFFLDYFSFFFKQKISSFQNSKEGNLKN